VEYEEYTRSYDIRYVAEIRHLKLEKFRVLKVLNKHILKSKIRAQFKVWDDQWEKQELRRLRYRNKDANSNAAAEKTAEAQQIHLDIENILLRTLSIDDTINWSSLID